jgi:hypothetical protein
MRVKEDSAHLERENLEEKGLGQLAFQPKLSEPGLEGGASSPIVPLTVTRMLPSRHGSESCSDHVLLHLNVRSYPSGLGGMLASTLSISPSNRAIGLHNLSSILFCSPSLRHYSNSPTRVKNKSKPRTSPRELILGVPPVCSHSIDFPSFRLILNRNLDPI